MDLGSNPGPTGVDPGPPARHVRTVPHLSKQQHQTLLTGDYIDRTVIDELLIETDLCDGSEYAISSVQLWFVVLI